MARIEMRWRRRRLVNGTLYNGPVKFTRLKLRENKKNPFFFSPFDLRLCVCEGGGVMDTHRNRPGCSV